MTSAPADWLVGGLWRTGAATRPALTGIGEGLQQHRGNGVLAGRHTAVDDRYLVGICGQPYWTDDTLAALARAQGQAQALREAVVRRPQGFLASLRGRFAAIVIDTEAETLLAAVDRIGRQTLYWAQTPTGLFCATRLRDLIGQPGVEARLCIQGIYHYAYFHMLPAPSTVFRDVFRLQGAQQLEQRGGTTTVTSYWVPDLGEPSVKPVPELEAELMAVMARGVTRGCDDEPAVGAFLSGGLDSSTVAGLLARQRPDHAPTFSIGFDAEGYDEMAYARAAARHFHNHQHEYYVTPDDVVRAVPEIAAFLDEPFGNSSALPALYCARHAREQGITRLLGGDGGDELFAGNARYAKQRIFEVYGYLPGPLRGTLEPLATRLPAVGPLRKLQSYIDQARVPLPDRLQSYNFLHRFGLETVFSEAFLAEVDTAMPLRLQREIYQRPSGQVSSLNRMLYQDWQQTLADNDLRKVLGMADLAGIQVAFPLLDDEVVEFSTRIPSSLKLKGTRLRHFYRQALRDFLPSEVLGKSKHGFGLPFGVWMRDHPPLQELAYDSLADLGKRGYFRRAFLEDLVHRHRHEHAAYYGEALWILMMLELWLQHHGHPN